MSTPSVEILSRAEWPGQGRREECEVSAPRAHLWGREEEKEKNHLRDYPGGYSG